MVASVSLEASAVRRAAKPVSKSRRRLGTTIVFWRLAMPRFAVVAAKTKVEADQKMKLKRRKNESGADRRVRGMNAPKSSEMASKKMFSQEAIRPKAPRESNSGRYR